MSDVKKKILKANFQNIVQNMAEVDIILDHLLQGEIISRNFMETVLVNRGYRSPNNLS